ncbi:HbrB-like-domain-containing protein [Mycena metata]|uniref:HbrB-like-domain-containing protein n=1 Tax=Mycena metata TaxID=1033252 RepID=A0AAD7KGM6_9AGAR|nr:HbrB-like-domain-containing protein [Mycena metata]
MELPRSSSDSSSTPRPPAAPVPRFLDRNPTADYNRAVFVAENRLVAPMASSSTTSKTHTSPSKASYGRTYDSKLVSREMHRLGLAPGLSQAPSVTSLALPAPGSMAQVSLASSSSDPWGALHVQVLPLFNGEPLRIPIEDLNQLVKRHIGTVVSASPSKAVATLEHDAAELIASGMVTLNAKLAGTDDAALVRRVVEVWSFFWDQVLTYVEGVLFCSRCTPTRCSRPSTAANPTARQSPRQASKGNINFTPTMAPNNIDVRTVALRSFRDKVIVPLATRLRTCIVNREEKENAQDTATQARLQQMLLPSPNEAAVADLLRAVRSPRPQFDAKAATTPISPPRAPSFLSGGLPRDRRGRIAQKSLNLVGIKVTEEGDDDLFGDETPKVAQGLTGAGAGAGGGWGLGPGGGTLDSARPEEEEDEPPLNWDEAQAVVERMVGMSMNGQSEMRRRP